MTDTEAGSGSAAVAAPPALAPGTPGAPAGAGGEGEQFFLTVDDRTRYRTADEAVAGFKTAGERIAALSNWEKSAQEYGLESPEDLPAILDEYIEMKRAAQAGQPAAPAAGATTPAAAPAGAGEGASPEEQKVLTWLEKRGYVTSAQLDEYKAKLEKVEQATTAREKTAMVNSGRTSLTEMVRERGLPVTDEKFMGRVERHVRSFLEEQGLDQENQIIPGGLLAQFWSGGAGQRKAIEAAVADFMDTLEFGRNYDAAKYQREKEGALKGSVKPLPPGGVPAVAPVAMGQPKTFAEAHGPAWKRFQEKLTGGGA